MLHSQEVKQLLEQGQQQQQQQQQQRLDVKETLLQTIASIGRHTQSPSAQLLVLALLLARLDDPDPGIRSFAAQLLLGEPPSPLPPLNHSFSVPGVTCCPV